MRRLSLIFLGAFSTLSAAAGASISSVNWHETLSPHFQVMHEASFSPPGFTLSLEKVHNRLRMDLAMLSPWMTKERVNLYLYANPKSYLAGEFKPPLWSNGLAYYDRKLIVVPDGADKKKLLSVISHEMTHLLFESYWGESRKVPPHWLNEGLAMMEEAASDDARKSEWTEAMASLSANQLIPFPRLIEMVPTETTDPSMVSLWYVEAYSIVYFIYREHSRLQFYNFCQELRDGESLQKALWLVYRYPDPEKFEAAWKQWLKLPPAPPGNTHWVAFRSRPKIIGFSDFTFHNFREQPPAH